jgi:glutaredoxin
MVKIYTTDTCPRCKVLKVKMDKKGIPYESITDVKEIQKLGIMSVPYMQVDNGELMDFATANTWINNQN